MNYALYPGCLILQRMQAYEESARAVFRALGIPVENLLEWSCCGGLVVESFREDWFVLSAYNLALAASQNVNLLTLCGGCTSALRRARHLLETDEQARKRAKKRLARIGLTLEYIPEVHHILQVLDEHRPLIAENVINRLEIRATVTSPCQVFRPPEIAQFGDPLRPKVMRRLVELTGAEVIAYDGEYDCCGSSLLIADRELAFELGRRKHLGAQEADVIVDACGNCHMLLERHAAAIAQGDRSSVKPVLFVTQVLGLALGLPRATLSIPQRSMDRVFGDRVSQRWKDNDSK